MRRLVCIAVLASLPMAAQAAPCTVQHFSSAHGELYLQAETALLKSADASEAADIVGQLWSADLNCYERRAVRKLGAATYVELAEYQKAIDLLAPLTADTSLPDAERAKIAFNIGMLYQALGDQTSAEPFLALHQKLGPSE